MYTRTRWSLLARAEHRDINSGHTPTYGNPHEQVYWQRKYSEMEIKCGKQEADSDILYLVGRAVNLIHTTRIEIHNTVS